jgi:cell division protease FtsH
MDKKTTFNTWYFVAAFAGILLVQSLIASFAGSRPIAYSEFQQLLRDGKVAEVAVSDRFISGVTKEPLPSGETRFTTTRVEENFAEELGRFGVKITGQIESTFLRDLLSWVVPVLLFVGIWFFVIRKMAAGGGLGGGLIGKSKAKVYVETDTGVTFADVAGVDEAKAELQESSTS